MQLSSLFTFKKQKPFSLTGDLAFLVGIWEWQKTKFLVRIIPKIESHYKTPATEGFNYSIVFTESGEMNAFKNGTLVEARRVIKATIYDNNLYKDGITEVVLLTEISGKRQEMRFQKLYNYDTINALYSIPFSKSVGASYNWFNKRLF